VSDDGSDSFYRKIISPKCFDRTQFDQIAVWPNVIRPKGHLTETPFDRTSFDRMLFDRKVIKPNRRLTEHHLAERLFYRNKVIWPIFFLSKGRLTEIFGNFSYDRNYILKK
jgi:hypothetical protein